MTGNSRETARKGARLRRKEYSGAGRGFSPRWVFRNVNARVFKKMNIDAYESLRTETKTLAPHSPPPRSLPPVSFGTKWWRNLSRNGLL
jgi:hypothetical protein